MSSADVRQKIFRVPSNVVLSVGLCWDFIGFTPVDLDLSAVCFNKHGQFLDVVFFNHLFPEGTDTDVLRRDYLIDAEDLPYMFLSGDSTLGGEEENQLSGLELAARRRKNLLGNRNQPGKHSATTGAENLFNRLYEEEELAGVQEAVNEYYNNGGEITVENGVVVNRRARREMCDEVLTFLPGKIPADAEVIFLCVTSYSGQDFTTLSRARMIIYNETTSERVGTFDLKAATGSGSAALAAMLVRVPPEQRAAGGAVGNSALDDTIGLDYGPMEYWDLREVSVRTYGYTFVDVLPLMLDVLGVPKHSRPDALTPLPDYTLFKSRHDYMDLPLSDLRFGIGWEGEHDLDAFMVMLDEQNNYVDHVYPKQGKLRSTIVSDMARHSGDALTGMNVAGDEEFIDLLTYRVPSNVRTILLGCTYMESFGANKKHFKSIYDVPNFYMRLQNRTLVHPHSFEIDRWDVRKDYQRDRHHARTGPAAATEEKKGKGKDHASGGKKTIKTSYRAADHTTQHVRTLLLGVLVKKGTAPFESLFPDGRRLDQHFRRHNTQLSSANGDYAAHEDAVMREESASRRTVLEAELDEEVPLFELVPVHQYVPVDPRAGFSKVMPYLQCISTFLCGSSAARPDNRGATGTPANSTVAGSRRGPEDGEGYVLDRENNMVGWDHTATKSVGGQAATLSAYTGIWESMQEKENLAQRFAVEVRFLEVVALEPRLPDRYKCHGEAWVSGQSDTLTGDNVNRPLKTPFLVNRDRPVWDANSRDAARVFLVHKYDRIRVMLYEYAAFGYADIDLMQMGELWQGDGRPVECNVALLGGGHLARGEVRVRLTRLSYRDSQGKVRQQATREATRKAERQREDKRRAEAAHNDAFNPCSIM